MTIFKIVIMILTRLADAFDVKQPWTVCYAMFATLACRAVLCLLTACIFNCFYTFRGYLIVDCWGNFVSSVLTELPFTVRCPPLQLSGILWRLSSDVGARAAYVSELIARFSTSSHWNRRQMSVILCSLHDNFVMLWLGCGFQPLVNRFIIWTSLC